VGDGSDTTGGVVERDQEQVPSIQRLQHGLATTLSGDGIAQRPLSRPRIEVCSRKVWTRSD
jgi:hypothetical protein